jgi:hypothetical protein
LLNKDQIRKNLKNDPYWEPDEDANYEEWELFDEVCDEMDKDKKGKPENAGEDTSDSSQENDDDSEWPDDDDDY